MGGGGREGVARGREAGRKGRGVREGRGDCVIHTLI